MPDPERAYGQMSTLPDLAQAKSLTGSGPSFMMTIEVLAGALRDATIPLMGLLLLWTSSLVFIPGFRSLSHVMYILKISSFLGIVAAGQTLVILTGGIDLSVSGVITLAAVVCAQLIGTTSLGTPAAIAIALLVSLGIGLLNAAGILTFRLHPLVMTLAMVTMLEGGLLIYTNGAPVSGRSALIDWIGNGTLIPGVPNPILTWIVVGILLMWLLHFSRYGRYILAAGTNPLASYISGVNIRKTTVLVYALSSLMAGITGILLLGYVSTTYLTMGVTYQMGSIASVVVGGTSIMGGKGTYLGTFIGAILLTLITSVLTVIKIPEGARQIIYGCLIIGIFIAYVYRNSVNGHGRRQ